jgi:hypothetical protein
MKTKPLPQLQIPVSKPINFEFAGTWSTVYPAEYMKKKKRKTK